jgi:hypothetical protein
MSIQINQIFVEKHNDPAKVRYTWGAEAVVCRLGTGGEATYPSLYKLYMEMEDVTEWEFAMAYIGSWETWQNIVNAKWFQPIITRWRKELELKLKARHLKQIKELAEGTGKDKLTANKYLLDKGYTFEDQPKRGRPSKTEIQEKVNQIAEFEKETQEDLQRILN